MLGDDVFTPDISDPCLAMPEPYPIDATMRRMKQWADEGKWGGVHILMGWRRAPLLASGRADVIEFLADMDPKLEAGRARASEDGWYLPKSDRCIWWCPTKVEGGSF